MEQNAVALTDVHVHIPVIVPDRLRLLRSPLRRSSVGGDIESHNNKLVVHALRGISFHLRRGDNLALIGHNGAGKSTLLRVIAGILPVSHGSVEVCGSTGCLFEIGGGIGGDLTGYECIKYQCLINGLETKQWPEISREVAEFTDLGSYLNLPIRTYSDGMRARLFAALATAWRHDILVIDEGIGAGDHAFQEKFSRRLSTFMKSASLLVIASHNKSLLRAYCTQGLILKHGQAQFLGPLEQALAAYGDAG